MTSKSAEHSSQKHSMQDLIRFLLFIFFFGGGGSFYFHICKHDTDHDTQTQ
uniref:Uncharacterized protein n=1 Tax=Octopus bimaculoides TaxID=37653 RepID=A0A0L8ICT7_OCTBM